MSEYQRIWIDGEEVYCKSDSWINADSDSVWDEEAMKDLLMEEYISNGATIDESIVRRVLNQLPNEDRNMVALYLSYYLKLTEG
ncbi:MULTISPECIES: hypothetical protein [unclassified Exiguobacterium]|uniref:hypothetical protein n=1 Tax=unclassified Exiguobacterium TaxID=2644629 RepID=UPI0025B7C47A|nr:MULTISPECIES: hypothetical protein [unclassified Exiguobacterium]